MASCLMIVSLAWAGLTPVLRVEGHTLRWTGNASGERYIVERKPGPSFTEVIGKSYTPPAAPGHTDGFRVRPGASPNRWSNEVTITWANVPAVKTEPASSVTQTSATLNATVNPNGSEVTECKLEYGTTTSYGKATTCTPAPGSGSSNVSVSAVITGLTENTTYHFRIVAKNAGGTSEGVDETFKTTSTPVKHLEYVLNDGTTHVYSIDEGFKEVESFSLPETNRGVRGVEECPATGVLYVSFGGKGGGSNGGALAYNLITKTLIWSKNYSNGVDSFALSKNCSKIYMPLGSADSSGEWKVVNATTGENEGSISTPGSGPHDGTLSSDGKLLILGEEKYNHLVLYHTETGKVQTQAASLVSGVRPNTVNGADTEAFTTATGFTGFQVSSTAEGGAVQYTENFGGACSLSTCSHGISLSPDNREVAVIDTVHKAAQFWNVEGVEKGTAPTHVATVLVAGLSGIASECAADCEREGWIQHSYDGRYVFVGSSGDVIETATHTVVAHLSHLENTRKMLEVDWEGGKTVASTQRTGVGR